MTIFRFFLFFLWLSLPLTAETSTEPNILYFDGQLSQEKMKEIKAKIEEMQTSPPKEIYCVVHSQSGEIVPVIDVAKTLFSLREQTKAKCIVFINDEAIGPAAVIPFLADELYISPVVAWGSIESHAESDLPLNILRSRIQGLLRPEQAHFSLLKLMASAMIDPEVVIVENDGSWTQEFSPKEGQEVVTRKGETVVMNQNQLKKLNLIAGVLTQEAFTARFFKQEKKEETKKLEIATLPLAQSIVQSNVQSNVQSFEQKLREHVHFPPNTSPRIGYIAIADKQEAISQSTWIYVTSALNFYKKSPPSCIILELNTPGGEVFAAERISEALKEMDTQYSCPIIAYINNWAISAGAMLAYSCRFIVVAKDASMGAAEPVYMGGGGKPETASEKVNSALRTDFANHAKFFDRNPYIAEAMVDKDVILVKRYGDIIKLDSEDQIRKGGIDPDIIISPKGKLLTLNADEMIEDGVANVMLDPMKLEPLTQNELESGLYPINKSVFTQIAYFREVPNLQIESYQMNWQTRFLAFLSSPAISSLLFLGMIIAFYMELSTGGFGLAGAVGLICVFLVLLSSFALEAIHWLEPILFIFGLALVLIEVFFFPTLGILGIVGAVFMIMGLTGMMVPGIGSVSFEGESINAAGEYVLERLAWFSGALLIALVIIGFLSRYMWPKVRLLQKMMLTEASRSQAAIHGTMLPSPLTELPEVGTEARVTAALRPAGKIFAINKDVDAVSSGNFIAEGTLVRVVRIEGSKVIVEEIFSS